MTKTTKEFLSAYKKLNQEQKLAVDTIDGPVMLVAGPGTGKTQTLALRIANIISQTDSPAFAILALTFTESGASAMRERLQSFIGSQAYYCEISTFHSFCIEVIKDNPDVFTLDPLAEPLSELEKLKLIYELIASTPLKHLSPVGARYYYAKAILGAISDLKREAVDEAELEDLLRAEADYLQGEGVDELKKTELGKRLKNLAKNQELLILYRAYEQRLADTGAFDFEDMISSVVDAFKSNPDLLASVQEKYLYILVDEYQDTNSAQNELLLALASFWADKANVFVTGDPDQSIMRFQGASIENQLSFIKVYPEAKVITLKQNYRSTQNILDASDALITHNNLRISDVVPLIDPHLVSQIGAGDKLALATLSGSSAETIFIAHDIAAKIKSGVSPSDIAVIYHTNYESTLVAQALVKYGVDYAVQGGANILEDPTVTNFLKIIRTIYEMRTKVDDDNLFTILHYTIFGIDALDVLKISRLAADHRLTLFDVTTDPTRLDSLELTTRSQVDRALAQLATWQSFEAEHTFTEFFEEVLNKSGYLKWVLGESDAHHRLARLNTLFDEVKRMNRSDHNLGLDGFIQNLDLMEENNLRLEESDYGVSQKAVTLTTAHKSKGLEWEHVYIYAVKDGAWGNKKNRDLLKLPESVLKNVKLSDKEKNEDERRLFYVAMTRAKLSLTLCRALTYSSYGSTREAAPSMFMSELPPTLLESLDVQKIEDEAHLHIERLLKSRNPVDAKHNDRAETELLEDLVAKFKLSATSLNSYLHCAYKFKLDQLLRVPHAKKPHLAYGTAVHKAFEKFYGELGETSVVPSQDYLLSEFRRALEREVINQVDLEIYQAKGETELTSYYELNKSSFKNALASEKNIKIHLGDPPRVGERQRVEAGITLTGKIDRLEWFKDPELAERTDQSAKLVRVIDYKTGKPKTMGEIEGTTKDGDRKLARQLEFYKLLINGDPSLNYQFGEGVLDFIQEPSLSGKDGKKSFLVQDEAVEELKKTIVETMASIRALHFPRTTDYKKCEDCYFKDHCWPEGIPIN